LYLIQENYNNVVDLSNVNFSKTYTKTKYYNGYEVKYEQYTNKENGKYTYPIKVVAYENEE
jgi:hypothetical protein